MRRIFILGLESVPETTREQAGARPSVLFCRLRFRNKKAEHGIICAQPNEYLISNLVFLDPNIDAYRSFVTQPAQPCGHEINMNEHYWA